MLSYGERVQYCTNSTAKKLFEIIERKQSNLAFNPDVTSKAEFLKLTQAVADDICILKTHIDIVRDFDQDLIDQITALAKKHDFIIFEDRKFADIGSVVKSQYQHGIYQIADWAPIVNAHSISGPGVVQGLKEAGADKGNALLLIAQLSSQGNLIDEEYCQQTVEMAKANSEFVIGFICQHRLTDDPNFIHLTPGIKFGGGGDNLGQAYTTPETAIIERGVDVIIVGRDIYQNDNPQQAAQRYREAGWQAYQQRLATVV